MTDFEPPDLRKTLIATGIALVVAVVVLLVAILPAEYGVDPTRVGGLLGFDALSDDGPPVLPPVVNTSVESRELFVFNATWPEATALLSEDSGDLGVGEEATFTINVPDANVTAFAISMAWTDDDVAGQATDPDTFQLTIASPQGTERVWLGRNTDGTAGSLEAAYILAAPPSAGSLTAGDEQEARQGFLAAQPARTEGTGDWRVTVELREAGGLGVVPDDGNDFSIRFFATTYALALGEATATGLREDTIDVTVPAGDGVEYKVFAETGFRFDYEWSAPQAMFYDFHGVRQEGNEESHESGTASGRKGSLLVPFDGLHGWYWENDGLEDITVTLSLRGQYRIV